MAEGLEAGPWALDIFGYESGPSLFRWVTFRKLLHLTVLLFSCLYTGHSKTHLAGLLKDNVVFQTPLLYGYLPPSGVVFTLLYYLELYNKTLFTTGRCLQTPRQKSYIWGLTKTVNQTATSLLTCMFINAAPNYCIQSFCFCFQQFHAFVGSWQACGRLLLQVLLRQRTTGPLLSSTCATDFLNETKIFFSLVQAWIFWL